MNWERHAASIELCLSISRVEVNLRFPKIHKTVKAKTNHFYFKEKESLPATSEQQKTPQDSEYN